MKKIIILLCAIFFFISCSPNDYNYESPYLPFAPVNIQIDMNNPQYRILSMREGAVFIDDGYSGVLGVIIFNSGNGFRAYDAACPNHSVRDCSTLQFDKELLYCECQNDNFSMYDGSSLERGYRLREYRVTTYKNIIEIHN